MKKIIDDFKKFAFKGNVLDMAIGVIIGGAFSKIVTSVVNDLVMPLFGAIIGGNAMADLKWVIKPADKAAGIEELSLQFGSFMQTVVDFLIIALSIFVFIKIIGNVMRKKEVEEAPPQPPKKEDTVILLEEIRDYLKNNSAPQEAINAEEE